MIRSWSRLAADVKRNGPSPLATRSKRDAGGVSLGYRLREESLSEAKADQDDGRGDAALDEGDSGRNRRRVGGEEVRAARAALAAQLDGHELILVRRPKR